MKFRYRLVEEIFVCDLMGEILSKDTLDIKFFDDWETLRRWTDDNIDEGERHNFYVAEEEYDRLVEGQWSNVEHHNLDDLYIDDFYGETE